MARPNRPKWGELQMGRIQYIVAEEQGQWFVELQGQLYGPYRTRELAVKDAVRGARTAPNAEVLIQGCNEPDCGMDTPEPGLLPSEQNPLRPLRSSSDETSTAE